MGTAAAPILAAATAGAAASPEAGPAAAAPPPRLRSDLVVSRQESPEGIRFFVKDPRSGAFFRMREAEYAVARRLDGASTLDQVAAGLAAELGIEATAADLAPFVEQLGKRGLLEKPGVPAAPAAPAKKPIVRGSLLWLRFAAFDPDRFLTRLSRWTGFLYTPWFVASGALVFLWALLATWQYRFEIGQDLAALWRLDFLAVAWVTVLAATALHEISHGLTVKRFGGEVHEMGFLLIYFQPAFYCDVSDAYLFPQRSRRLWVTFAGAYCDLVAWGAATLVWRVVERGAWPASLALVVMATCGIRTFFNLNPLLKLDGYYILTDLVQVPNLRPRAFGYVGALLKRAAGLPAAVAEASPRERRIFLTYGVFAGVFSYWFLTTFLLSFGAYLTWKYQGWGFAAITGLSALTFLPTPKLPQRGRLAILGGSLLVLLAVLPWRHTVSGEAVLLPQRNADARAVIEGILEEVLVDEGDVVAAGAVLARVSDRGLRSRLAMVDAEIAEQDARARLLRAGARPEELERARIAVRKAESRLSMAETEVKRNRELAGGGLLSKAELERSETEKAVRSREVEEAQAFLRDLEAGARPEEIAAVEQRVARGRAERARLDWEIAHAGVVTPHAGVVTTPRLREKVGEFVKPGDLVAEVFEIRTLKAEVAVHEQESGAVRPGMEATLRFRSIPERTFVGTVAAVAPAALDVGRLDGRVVRVTIDVDNADGLLKPNQTGYARIDAGERRALDLVTRGVRRFARLEFWSWW